MHWPGERNLGSAPMVCNTVHVGHLHLIDFPAGTLESVSSRLDASVLSASVVSTMVNSTTVHRTAQCRGPFARYSLSPSSPSSASANQLTTHNPQCAAFF